MLCCTQTSSYFVHKERCSDNSHHSNRVAQTILSCNEKSKNNFPPSTASISLYLRLHANIFMEEKAMIWTHFPLSVGTIFESLNMEVNLQRFPTNFHDALINNTSPRTNNWFLCKNSFRLTGPWVPISSRIWMWKYLELWRNSVFWDVAPCRFCVNRRFGGRYRLHFQGRKIRERGTGVSRWLHLHLRAWMNAKRHWRAAEPQQNHYVTSHISNTLQNILVLFY
jgi:hypothetical protein